MGDDFDYESWEGHLNLPRLNLQHPEVKAMIFEAAAYWLREVGADGWRLDVAHEIPPEFWREFAEVCGKAKPDAVLVGELIHGEHHCSISNFSISIINGFLSSASGASSEASYVPSAEPSDSISCRIG